MDTVLTVEGLEIVPQQRITYIFKTTVNALIREEDRPQLQHRDHCPALFDKCVGSFNFPDRASKDWV